MQYANKGNASQPDAPVTCNRTSQAPSTALHEDRRHATAQLKARMALIADSPRMLAQRAAIDMAQHGRPPACSGHAGSTGLPAQLKSGIESLSGMSMDHVRVHYNSPQPAQLNAHAYAQGADIHLAPGQEKHLPHEAWHVVQQAQGRVQPTVQLRPAVAVNDNAGLEHEADVMGRRALGHGESHRPASPQLRAHAGSPVAQLAKKVTAYDDEGLPRRYIVIDVPSDGACLVHSFNMGLALAGFASELIKHHEARSLSSDRVEQMARDYFLEWVQARVTGESISLNAAFNRENILSRQYIAQEWRGAVEAGDAQGLLSLQADIQSIILTFASDAGLLQSQTPDHQAGFSDDRQAKGKEKEDGSAPLLPSSALLPFPASWAASDDAETPQSSSHDEPYDFDSSDEDFIYKAIHRPEAPHKFQAVSSKSAHGTSVTPAQRLLALTELAEEPIYHGVNLDGPLDSAIRVYVYQLLIPHIVDGTHVRAHSIVLPPPGSIPLELVGHYIDEFEVNTHLWASSSALSVLMSAEGATAGTNAFFANGDHVTSSMLDADIQIYEEGQQSHFQYMLGPFPDNWFADDPLAEPSGPSSEDQATSAWADDLESGYDILPPGEGSWYDILSAGEGSWDAKQEDDVVIEPDHAYSPQFPFSHHRAEMEHFISSVMDKAGLHHLSPQDVLQLVFRAGSVTETKNVFTDVKTAVSAIIKYDAIVQNGQERSARHGRPYTPPLVPLAGFVGQMIVDLGVPLFVLDHILPCATEYVAFHRQLPSWPKNQAPNRVSPLKRIATILNEWADMLGQPRLAVAPSVSQTLTRPSPLASDEHIGLSMRAVLTLDPGNLEGYEPEESRTWDAFREHLRGFVRAHLLNKHAGGSGETSNIGYLSSEDNLRMSDYGEEYTKREVLENNKRMFYRVDMPTGKPDLTQEPHRLDPKVAGMLAREVRLTAVEIRSDIGEEGETHLSYDPVHLKDTLGIQDDSVQQDALGRISFPTRLPDETFISKVQPHHGGVLREMHSAATNQSILAMRVSPVVSKIVREAQEAIVSAPHRAEAIIEEAGSQLLEQNLDPVTLRGLMSKLADVRRKEGSGVNAKKRKRDNEAKRKKEKKRMKFTEDNKLTQEQANKVATLSKAQFNRLTEVSAFKAPPGEALRIARLRGKEFKQGKKGLENRAKGGGLHKYFKPKDTPPPPGPSQGE